MHRVFLKSGHQLGCPDPFQAHAVVFTVRGAPPPLPHMVGCHTPGVGQGWSWAWGEVEWPGAKRE